MKHTLIFTAAMLVTTAAHADSVGEAGLTPCPVVASGHLSKIEDAALMGWIAGYASGRFGPNITYDDWPLRLYRWCQQHPGQSVQDAVGMFVNGQPDEP